MGYDIHITRAVDWTENAGQEISAEEWLEIVNNDQELTPDPDNGSYSAIWAADIEAPVTWLDWANGNIYTTNPGRAILSKMLQIAQQLGAKVQGDNGEMVNDDSEWSESWNTGEVVEYN